MTACDCVHIDERMRELPDAEREDALNFQFIVRKLGCLRVNVPERRLRVAQWQPELAAGDN